MGHIPPVKGYKEAALLFWFGNPRQKLVQWSVEAGHSDAHMSGALIGDSVGA